MDYKAYLDILREPEYIELYNYYSKETMMGILGVDRQENPHSGFLRWLLDIHGGHGYGDMAMRRLLETVCLFRDKVYVDTPERQQETEKSFWQKKDNLLSKEKAKILHEIRYGRYEIVHQSIANETVLKDQKRADIFAVLELKMQRTAESEYLILLIENKVQSLEHDRQTENYVKDVGDSQKLQEILRNQNRDFKIDWADEEKIPDIAEGSKLYVFLNAYPTKKIKDAFGKDQPQFAKSKEFITVNYQYLLDGIFEPLSNLTDNVEIKQRMDDYIRCLGQAKITSIGENEQNRKDGKEYLIMAVSGHEKKLAASLWKKHRQEIYAILESHFREGRFLLNEKDRDFWISYANLLLLMEQKEFDGQDVENVPDAQAVQELIMNANRVPGKHTFRFRNKVYESYRSGENNIGALCRDIIMDLIKDAADIEQWITEFHKKCNDRRKMNLLGKWILLEEEVVERNKRYNDGSYHLSGKFNVDGNEYTVNGYFVKSAALEGGKKVYIAKYWAVDEVKNLINFIDSEYNRNYENEVIQEYLK